MKNKYFPFTISYFILTCFTGYTINAQEPEQWVSYVSDNFNFSIDFPSIPSEVTDTVETEEGEMLLNVLELDCSGEENYSNLVYMINCTVYPQSLIHSDYVELLDNFFSGTINGAVSNISGELLFLRETEYKGYPGREVKIAASDGLTRFISRLYLIKNQFFMMIILVDTGKDDNLNINKFFNSFRYF